MKFRFFAPTETSLPRSSLATLAKLHADGSRYVSPRSLAFAGARAVSRPSGALAVFALSCRPVDFTVDISSQVRHPPANPHWFLPLVSGAPQPLSAISHRHCLRRCGLPGADTCRQGGCRSCCIACLRGSPPRICSGKPVLSIDALVVIICLAY